MGNEDTDTDIDDVFGAGIPQISFLAADAEIDGEMYYRIDAENQVVVLTLTNIGGVARPGENIVQIVLDCESGDIVFFYGEATFDLSSRDHWSIGISEPDVAGARWQPHDFARHAADPGEVSYFGPGGIGQSPERGGSGDLRPLDGQGILFHRIGGIWQVLVGPYVD